MPHHVTQRGNRRRQTFFGEEDVGPRHLPGDERPRARDPTLTAIGAFGLPFYRWRPRGPSPPSHESLEPVRIRSEEPNYDVTDKIERRS